MDQKYATFEYPAEGVLKVSFSATEPTEKQFEAYLHEYEKILKSSAGYAVVIDGSKARYLPSKLRARQGKWQQEQEALIIEKVLKLFFVITNPLVKYILQGIFLVSKPPVTYSVLVSQAQAVEEATEVAKALAPQE